MSVINLHVPYQGARNKSAFSRGVTLKYPIYGINRFLLLRVVAH